MSGSYIIYIAFAAVAGAGLGYFIAVTRAAAAQAFLKAELTTSQARLRDEQRLLDSVKAMSSDALHQNNESFMKLAESTLSKYQQMSKGELELKERSIENMVRPIKASLEKVDEKIRDLEKSREGAYVSVVEQLKSIATMGNQLQAETSNLVRALRAPNVRGRWGEIQLRRVVEMAGMLDHCDFVEQSSVTTDLKKVLRPDMIIKLPNKRQIVVDSKVPLSAFLEAFESTDDAAKDIAMREHARYVRTHIQALGSKSYTDQFEGAQEFVVMFLPGENFYSAALQYDPELIEYGVDEGVIIATPTTLIALLKTVAFGWRQESIADNAREISSLGADLYDRLRVFTSHFTDMGKGLDKALDSYNKAVRSYESRVLVGARRFKDLGSAAGDALSALPQVEGSPKLPQVDALEESLK